MKALMIYKRARFRNGGEHCTTTLGSELEFCCSVEHQTLADGMIRPVEAGKCAVFICSAKKCGGMICPFGDS